MKSFLCSIHAREICAGVVPFSFANAVSRSSRSWFARMLSLSNRVMTRLTSSPVYVSFAVTFPVTGTAGYSDIVFGLFWLLGFQFSPRLADIGESRFWRLDRTANYGALNGLASHRINPKLITQNWDDFLRVAGSL